ncbi:MAG TPA: NUDIX hydrolase [Firmicutes bacterium]|nr:NUDIX hydrolase [Bacillota bacterium]
MRVVHSLLLVDNQILLLFKPGRQKWFLPGGKAEFSENVIQTGCREFFEETGLTLKNAKLGGVTTVVVEDLEGKKEWMLYTVKSTESFGDLIEQNREGFLKWHPISEVEHLPMFEGDRAIVKHLISNDEPIISTQFYTPEYELIHMIKNNEG